MNILERPVIVELVSGYCNSKCAWCFMQYETGNQIPKGMISVEDTKRFLDINKNYKLSIVPFSHGEALIHPDFCEIIDLIENYNHILHDIHSNLSMKVSDECIKRLSRFKNITINIGGCTEITHKENMGTDLNTVIENLKRLRKLSSNSITVKMVINAININDNMDNTFKSLNVKTSKFPLYFSSSDSSNKDKIRFIERNFVNKDGTINTEVQCRDVVEYDKGIVKVTSLKSKYPCVDYNFVIRWNGNIQLCCRPRKHDGIIADGFKTSLLDIYKSDKLKEVIGKMAKREYVSYCKYCS